MSVLSRHAEICLVRHQCDARQIAGLKMYSTVFCSNQHNGLIYEHTQLTTADRSFSSANTEARNSSDPQPAPFILTTHFVKIHSLIITLRLLIGFRIPFQQLCVFMSFPSQLLA